MERIYERAAEDSWADDPLAVIASIAVAGSLLALVLGLVWVGWHLRELAALVSW